MLFVKLRWGRGPFSASLSCSQRPFFFGILSADWVVRISLIQPMLCWMRSWGWEVLKGLGSAPWCLIRAIFRVWNNKSLTVRSFLSLRWRLILWIFFFSHVVCFAGTFWISLTPTLCLGSTFSLFSLLIFLMVINPWASHALPVLAPSVIVFQQNFNYLQQKKKENMNTM